MSVDRRKREEAASSDREAPCFLGTVVASVGAAGGREGGRVVREERWRSDKVDLRSLDTAGAFSFSSSVTTVGTAD